MSDPLKGALILGVAIVLATTIAVSALIYFSPYQSCMRAVQLEDELEDETPGVLGLVYCAEATR